MAENEEALGGEVEEVAKKGGLPLKPILIGVVLLAVIGGIVWFVVMPMLAPAEETEGEEPVVEEVEETPVAPEGAYDFENPAGAIEFIEPFTLKLKKKEGRLEGETYLRVNVTFRVASVEVQDKIMGDKAVMAMLRSKVTHFFSNKFASDVEVTRWPILKEQLMEEINKLFQPEYQISDVYILDLIPQQ